ncbi:MAG TPA: FlgD immunoglobulin-like domain containing protein [Candidatus Eisenbacteria bacterium]
MRRLQVAFSRGIGTFVLVVVAILGLSSTVTSRPASAAWPEFGRAITTAPNNQDDSHAAPDGAGGAIVVWVDAGSGVVDLFAQHVLASGELDSAWPINGRALLTDPTALAVPSQTAPGIVLDGAGGAIVAWVDGRTSSVSGADVYAQHVLASGLVDARWPANGAALCTATGNQTDLAIVSDGAGGAIVTWMDARGSDTEGGDIFAQHVLASGVVDPDWKTNGAAVCTAPGRQVFPELDTDGAGGAIVTWSDPRSSVTGFDIYAQHVLSSGVMDLAWPDDGRALCTATGGQIQSTIVSDGGAPAAGGSGAIVSWSDARDGTAHIFAHHVLASGALDRAWPVDGLAVCTAPIEQQHAIMVSDDAGGAIVSWEDQRSGIHNIFAQHVLVSGAVDARWPVNGRALSTRPTEQTGATMVEDGAGGAIVAWQDGSVDIFAQHVLASGALDPVFPVDGRPVCDLPGAQNGPSMVAAGPADAIIAWTDLRSGLTSDIFALELQAAETTDVDGPPPAREVTFARPSPNPAVAGVTLRFALPRETAMRLAIYDVGGRQVRLLVLGAQPAGGHALAWDLRDESGQPIGTGIYFARLEAEGHVLARKVAKLN